MEILVQGVGGVGGYLAARLCEAGVALTPITGNPKIAEALNARGFELEEQGSRRRVPLTRPARAEPSPDGGPYDLIVLATQTTRLGDALRASAPMLAPEGKVLCLQNGLPEAYAQAIVAPERVYGGVVSWAASMPEHGVYVRTTPGRIQLGRPGSPADDAVRAMAALLAPVSEIKVVDNLLGVRWSKLAFNSTITTMGAVVGQRLGELVKSPAARDLGLQIITEVVEVTTAAGVHLEPVSGTVNLYTLALKGADRGSPRFWPRAWRHALVWAMGLKWGGARSSMLYAIERGRPVEVDFLNGEIVRHGARLGVSTPVNSALVQLVHRIAAHELPHSFEHLDRLRDEVAASYRAKGA